MLGPRSTTPPLLQFLCPTIPPMTARSWSDRQARGSEQFLVSQKSTTAEVSHMKHMKKGKNKKIMSRTCDHGATCVQHVSQELSGTPPSNCTHTCTVQPTRVPSIVLSPGPIIFISNNYVQRLRYCRLRSYQLFLQYNLKINMMLAS